MLQLGGLTLDLNDLDATGFMIAEVDLGFAQPRVVADDIPGQDGSDDQTANFSTRTIQLTGVIGPTLAGASRSVNFDAFTPFIFPGARPTLVYSLDDDMAQRCLDLRVNQWTNPINHPVNASAFSVQFVCPNPIPYDPNQQEVDVPFATGSTSGFTFPFTFPLTFGTTVDATEGSAFVTSNGTYLAWPLLRIFGPCTNPAVFWNDPITDLPIGVQVVFSGLTIAAGDYVEVDCRQRSALVDGDPEASVYQFVDFINSNFGPLQPGTNLLRATATTSAAGAVVQVLWHDTYLN